MDPVVTGQGFPVASQGGPGGFDGFSWFSNFTVDIDFGPQGLDAFSFFTSAISSFLAYEGSPIVRCGIISYIPLGQTNPVSLPPSNFLEYPSAWLPPVTFITFGFGCVITPSPAATTATVMANISLILWA